MSESQPVRTARRAVGMGEDLLRGVVRFTGPDAATFLHNQFTSDVVGLAPGQASRSAYLDRRGRLLFHMILLHSGEELLAIIEREQIGPLLETLETYHFAEEVDFQDRTDHSRILHLVGPAAPALLASVLGRPLPLIDYRCSQIRIAGAACTAAALPWTGCASIALLVPTEGLADVRSALEEAGEPEGLAGLDGEGLEVLRIEGGWPRAGRETGEDVLLPEIGHLEEIVSFEKGCYLGQEVVARIHSRGHVNRILVGLRVEGGSVPEPGTALIADSEGAGRVTSACASPSLESVVALAFVRTENAAAGTVLHLRLGDRLVAVQVADLPLYRTQGTSEVAQRLYQEGLEAFGADRFEEAALLLERTTLLMPHLFDAWEALGVTLDRMGDLPRAVETMRTLTEMDPKNVMAWSNLSQYHARQGDIEAAEKAQGEARFLSMQQQMGEAEARERAQAMESEQRARLEGRVETFREVLEMDPEDVVANFGLGKILLDLGRMEEAVPCFEAALRAQPDYSMAFLHLGTALEALGRTQEAAETWRLGIETAGRRGDLMPRRDMQRRLKSLPS